MAGAGAACHLAQSLFESAGSGSQLSFPANTGLLEKPRQLWERGLLGVFLSRTSACNQPCSFPLISPCAFLFPLYFGFDAPRWRRGPTELPSGIPPGASPWSDSRGLLLPPVFLCLLLVVMGLWQEVGVRSGNPSVLTCHTPPFQVAPWLTAKLQKVAPVCPSTSHQAQGVPVPVPLCISASLDSPRLQSSGAGFQPLTVMQVA